MSLDTSALQRWLQHDGTPEGQPRRPEFRHGTVLPQKWFAVLFNPASWKAGHWALFGALLTAIADLITFFYVANLLGIGHAFEIEMWLVIAGVMGFLTVTAALWAIWKNRGRGPAIWALLLGLAFGAAPAWLLGNTIVQFIVNGGTLPPPDKLL